MIEKTVRPIEKMLTIPYVEYESLKSENSQLVKDIEECKDKGMIKIKPVYIFSYDKWIRDEWCYFDYQELFDSSGYDEEVNKVIDNNVIEIAKATEDMKLLHQKVDSLKLDISEARIKLSAFENMPFVSRVILMVTGRVYC